MGVGMLDALAGPQTGAKGLHGRHRPPSAGAPATDGGLSWRVGEGGGGCVCEAGCGGRERRAGRSGGGSGILYFSFFQPGVLLFGRPPSPVWVRPSSSLLGWVQPTTLPPAKPPGRKMLQQECVSRVTGPFPPVWCVWGTSPPLASISRCRGQAHAPSPRQSPVLRAPARQGTQHRQAAHILAPSLFVVVLLPSHCPTTSRRWTRAVRTAARCCTRRTTRPRPATRSSRAQAGSPAEDGRSDRRTESPGRRDHTQQVLPCVTHPCCTGTTPWGGESPRTAGWSLGGRWCVGVAGRPGSCERPHA